MIRQTLSAMGMAAIGVLLLAGAAWAQEPHPEGPFAGVPEHLDGMIEIAMHNNPDIAVAEAHLHAAETELRRARLKAVRAVTELHRARMGLHHEIDRLIHESERPEENPEFHELHAELEEVAAQTRYLLGIGGEMHLPGEHEPRHPMHEQPLMPQPRPPMPPELAEKLAIPIAFEGAGETLAEVLRFAADSTGINIVLDFEVDPDQEVHITARRAMPLSAFLLAIADQYEFLCFAVRDYGLLLTHKERAIRLNGPAIPEDTPLLLPGEPREYEEREEPREREHR